MCRAAPGGQGPKSLSGAVIRRALADPQLSQVFVGVETFNGGLVFTRSNQKAQELTARLDIARVGSSGAHVLPTSAGGSTAFQGETAVNLYLALKQHRTTARIGQPWTGFKALRQWLPPFLKRNLGWVIWNEDPEEPLRYARIKRVVPHPAEG
ncbi:MAG: hypothetical protein ACYC6L_01355 [Anaerolineae bacterium]